MVSKKLREHLTVLLITIIVFSVGVSIGLTINDYSELSIQESIEDFKDNINSLEIGFLLNTIGNKTMSCNFLQKEISNIREELNALGEEVVGYEADYKIRDDNYFKLKKEYTMVRAEYWLMLTKLKEDCEANYTTILYFYSTKTDCPACRDQGVILAHLSSVRDDLYVLPVDADEELLIIETLKTIYNVSSTPSIVINADLTISGLINEDEIISIIG